MLGSGLEGSTVPGPRRPDGSQNPHKLRSAPAPACLAFSSLHGGTVTACDKPDITGRPSTHSPPPRPRPVPPSASEVPTSFLRLPPGWAAALSGPVASPRPPGLPLAHPSPCGRVNVQNRTHDHVTPTFSCPLVKSSDRAQRPGQCLGSGRLQANPRTGFGSFGGGNRTGRRERPGMELAPESLLQTSYCPLEGP